MAVRFLLVLAAFAILYGCDQVSSPPERQEKQGGVEQAEEQQKDRATEEPPTYSDEAVTWD